MSENKETLRRELEQAITEASEALTRAQQLMQADYALESVGELKKKQEVEKLPEENDGNIPPWLLGKVPKLQ